VKEKEYPGGSKSRVNRAGDAVRKGNASEGDLAAIEEWRAAHRAVLNTFQAILRIRLRGKNVIVASHLRTNLLLSTSAMLSGKISARCMVTDHGHQHCLHSLNNRPLGLFTAM